MKSGGDVMGWTGNFTLFAPKRAGQSNELRIPTHLKSWVYGSMQEFIHTRSFGNPSSSICAQLTNGLRGRNFGARVNADPGTIGWRSLLQRFSSLVTYHRPFFSFDNKRTIGFERIALLAVLGDGVLVVQDKQEQQGQPHLHLATQWKAVGRSRSKWGSNSIPS